MLNSNSGAILFPEIGWCQTFHATPNQRSDMVDNALRVGEPVKDILHICRDPAKLRNAPTRWAAIRRTLSRHLRRQNGSPSYTAYSNRGEIPQRREQGQRQQMERGSGIPP